MPEKPRTAAGYAPEQVQRVRATCLYLATKLGDFAVQSLDRGATGVMAGEIRGELALTPFLDTYARHKAVPENLLVSGARFLRFGEVLREIRADQFLPGTTRG